MLVKCLYKFGKDLPDDCWNKESKRDPNRMFSLEVGKCYPVYAMRIFFGYFWYYICDEDRPLCPFHHPSPLFSVVDGSLSKYWVYAFEMDLEAHTHRTIITFPEWAYSDNYYDNLFDGEKNEDRIFQKYKSLMDVEFPDPMISTKAQLLDEKWLLCPLCIDAWESVNKDGMVICPNCHNTMHNPRYQGNSSNMRALEG